MRENAGMSREEVSMQSGVSEQVIESLETNFNLIR